MLELMGSTWVSSHSALAGCFRSSVHSMTLSAVSSTCGVTRGRSSLLCGVVSGSVMSIPREGYPLRCVPKLSVSVPGPLYASVSLGLLSVVSFPVPLSWSKTRHWVSSRVLSNVALSRKAQRVSVSGVSPSLLGLSHYFTTS